MSGLMAAAAALAFGCAFALGAAVALPFGEGERTFFGRAFAVGSFVAGAALGGICSHRHLLPNVHVPLMKNRHLGGCQYGHSFPRVQVPLR